VPSKEQNYHAQLRVDWSGGRPAAKLEAASARGSEQAKGCCWQLGAVAGTEPAGLDSICWNANDVSGPRSAGLTWASSEARR